MQASIEAELSAEVPVQPDVSVFDPLQAFTKLPYTATVFPHGFPACIRSNDKEVLRAAELSWGIYPQRFNEAPVELRVIVSNSPCRLDLPIPVFRAQCHLLTAVSDANHFAVCDLTGAFGFACTTKDALSHADFFRYYFLEGIVYTLLDSKHLATIHSACVSWNGRGILLIGDSGAGKSSFAYACTRRGWTYTSDDASSMLLTGNDRTVFGNPQTFRFRPSVAALFPELQGHIRERNGKPTLEIRTEEFPHVTVADRCRIDSIIFLNRRGSGHSPPGLAPISREERFRRLSQNPWPAELPTHAARCRAIERLSEAPGFELTYREFGPAIDLLQTLIPRIEA